MDLPEEKYCKGCICKGCRKSEINGAMFVCNSCGCSGCSEETGYLKLQSCTDIVPYVQNDTDDLRL